MSCTYPSDFWGESTCDFSSSSEESDILSYEESRELLLGYVVAGNFSSNRDEFGSDSAFSLWISISHLSYGDELVG
jgi:hypothetical protein